MTHGLLIAGHGSRDPEGIQEFLSLARHFRALRPDLPLEIAFLEFARPTIQEGIDRLVAGGAETIVVLPGVLMAAGHAKNDMASEVRLARQRHPHVTLHMGAALDIAPQLLQLCHLRYREALTPRPAVEPRDTLLLLVGRGSGDPDANSNVAKVARFLQEGYPTGWSACAFSGIAPPLLQDALPVCERMGFRRIVVQPYFLFTGILLKRIYATVAARQRERPDLEFVATPHLQAHPLLLEVFAQRLDEALHGTGHMNCSLCRYRVPILGHEAAQGEPQQPHHHHVQGLHGHVHHLDTSSHAQAHQHAPGKHAHGHEHAHEEASVEPHAWSSALLERLRY